MSKVFKKVKRAFKKVVKGVVKVVKKIAKSKIFRAIAIAAAVYFTGGAVLGAMGGLSSGAGMLSGAMSGISSAWAGITGAGSALMAGNLSGAASSLTGGLTGAFGKGAGILANAATSLGSGAPGAPNTLAAFTQQNEAKALLANSGKSPFLAEPNLPGLPGGAPWVDASKNAVEQVTKNAAGNGLLNSVAPYAVYSLGQGLAGHAAQKAEEEKAQKEYERYNENMGAPLWSEQANAVEKRYGNYPPNPTYNARY